MKRTKNILKASIMEENGATAAGDNKLHIHNSMLPYETWESNLIQFVETKLDMCTSDAQSYLEAQAFYVQQAWTKGLNSEDTFAHIELMVQGTKKAKEAIDQVVEMLKPVVAKIEGGLETTKNHYGSYMAVLSQAGQDKQMQKKMAACLIKAGANQDGVANALKNI